MMRSPGVLFAGLWLACDPASSQEPVPTKSASAATPVADTPSAEPMPERKPQSHISGATDTVLASDDPGDALDALMDALMDAETPGIRIDAPFVAARDAEAVPVVGAFVRVPKAREAFDNRVVVLAVSKGRLEAHPALRVPKMKGGKGGPGQDVLKGSAFHFDAQARLPKTAWDEDVRLYVAYTEHISNGVTVRHGADAPLAPAEPSPLQLQGPASAKTEPGGTVSLTGKSSASSTVHIVGLGGADPFVHTLEAGADGSFAVNLLGDNPLPKAPGTWHVYAFSGEHVAGPVSIELTPGETPW
ncbi:MAG: hypothetical protein KUG77_07600 [Nannocystaceae bacterium]|nr:hypothetical protein [Nannocystaceae bacterium]